GPPYGALGRSANDFSPAQHATRSAPSIRFPLPSCIETARWPLRSDGAPPPRDGRHFLAVMADAHPAAASLYHAIWRAFAVLLPVRTVGVMGDDRTYDQACALRA